MAEEKKIATGYIGNALRSAADNHTTTFADEIFDTERQKYQNEVNTDLETTDNEIKANLEAETARAKAAEEANTQAIADEVTRAKAAEEAIIFDVSVYNNGAVFESISALLGNSNLDTIIPMSFRHGGMTIRFIQGSEQIYDNKYMQYRLMSQTFSTDEADWQGVDDYPTAGSDNLVKSGGVNKKLVELETKTEEITKEVIETEDDYICIEDNNGNEVFHLDENGLDAKNVKSNGKPVLTEHQDISNLATKEEVKSEVEEAKVKEISSEISEEEEDYQAWDSNDYDGKGNGERYGKMTPQGMYAKAYFKMDGTPIGGGSTGDISIDTVNGILIFGNYKYKLIPYED